MKASKKRLNMAAAGDGAWLNVFGRAGSDNLGTGKITLEENY